ncbi:MAG: hypothetical protein ABSB79_11050 [Syntrophales bacterium]|jgi:hypothetical protein
MSPKEKIDVLLKEYDSLRSEIISRIQSRFTVTGIIVALAVFIVNEEGQIELIMGGILVIAILFFWWRVRAWILLCSVRISEIEEEINKLAEDKLLVWETRLRKKS